MKILFIGNCQFQQIIKILRITLPRNIEFLFKRVNNLSDSILAVRPQVDLFDVVVTNVNIEKLDVPKGIPVLRVPDLQFGGFHPDQTYVTTIDRPARSLKFFGATPVSALAFWGFSRGLSVQETADLYCADVFERLGYFDYFDVGQRALEARFKTFGFDCSRILHELNQPWISMHGAWHPKIALTAHLADLIYEKLDIRPMSKPSEVAPLVPDILADNFVWGVYPPVADYLGVPGTWVIRQNKTVFSGIKPYLGSMFEAFNERPKGSLCISDADRGVFDMERYDKALGAMS